MVLISVVLQILISVYQFKLIFFNDMYTVPTVTNDSSNGDITTSFLVVYIDNIWISRRCQNNFNL